MHADCIRRGICSDLQLAGKAVAQCPDQRAFSGNIAQCLRHPMAGRGLAVGAGDTDQPHTLPRSAITRTSQPPGLVAQIGHTEIGHLPCIVPDEMLRIPYHRVRALLYRGCNELPAIGFFTRTGDKGISRLHGAPVRHQACDGHVQRRQLFKRKHHTSSLMTEAGETMTLSSGASFGTLSMCSASPVTLLNTGAATDP